MCWKRIPLLVLLVNKLVGITKRITFGTNEMIAVAAKAFSQMEFELIPYILFPTFYCWIQLYINLETDGYKCG